MADVARGHDGDCGPPGGPPDGGDWQPPSGCQGRGGSKRGKTRNKGLKATIKRTESNTLPVDFEVGKNSTYVAVGPNGNEFNTLVGTIVSKIPSHFESWKKIPRQYTATIIPEIQSYFDLSPHLEGPEATNIEKGIYTYCQRRYRDQKNKLKANWFDKRGGINHVDTLRRMPPPDMTEDDWDKFVSLVTNTTFLKRSDVNKGCRDKQEITVHQGRRSMAQNRYVHRDKVTNEPPSPIDEYRRLRTRKGQFTQQAAVNNYGRMIAMKEQQANVPNPMTDEEIVEEVLGLRRGWQRGIGQKLSQSAGGSSSSGSQTSQRLFTQDEVQRMMSQMHERMMSSVKSHTAPLFKAMSSQGFLPEEEVDEDEDDEDEDDEDEDDDEEDDARE